MLGTERITCGAIIQHAHVKVGSSFRHHANSNQQHAGSWNTCIDEFSWSMARTVGRNICLSYRTQMTRVHPTWLQLPPSPITSGTKQSKHLSCHQAPAIHFECSEYPVAKKPNTFAFVVVRSSENKTHLQVLLRDKQQLKHAHHMFWLSCLVARTTLCLHWGMALLTWFGICGRALISFSVAGPIWPAQWFRNQKAWLRCWKS
jgi:hypothetical protein